MISRLQDLLRHILTKPLSDRDIAATFSVSKTTVGRYRRLARERELTYEQVAGVAPKVLHDTFNLPRSRPEKRRPDFEAMDAELATKGVSRQLLWEEYRAQAPSGALSYSQFTTLYREHRKCRSVVMRQHHVPGERVYVDYSGKRPGYVDVTTGKTIEVELFVGVLGASSYLFAHCTPTQSIIDWIDSHVRMFEFFGGVPQVVVPDNLKSAVTKPGRAPVIQRTYLDFAEHYDVGIQPARPYKPRDKAKAENGVQFAQRWILAVLRHRTFYTLADLNNAIAVLLTRANERPFRHMGGSRRERFEKVDRPALRALPPTAYRHAVWTSAQKVPPDYHVDIQGHRYSVPHGLVGKGIEGRVSSAEVELFCEGACVAVHPRSAVKGGHTTAADHQPEAHRAQAQRTPEGFVAWAETVGPNTVTIVRHQLAHRTPLQGLPACEALRELERRHSAQAIEVAAERAVRLRVPTATAVGRFVRDSASVACRRRGRAGAMSQIPKPHANVRGADYYRGKPS